MTQNFPESRDHGLLRPLKNPIMERDEEGRNYLTKKYVVDLCEFNGQYINPICNNKLFLHYKGKYAARSMHNLTAQFEFRLRKD